MKLATFVMETRGTLGKPQVDLQQQMQANSESIAFLQRQLSELAAGSGSNCPRSGDREWIRRRRPGGQSPAQLSRQRRGLAAAIQAPKGRQ